MKMILLTSALMLAAVPAFAKYNPVQPGDSTTTNVFAGGGAGGSSTVNAGSLDVSKNVNINGASNTNTAVTGVFDSGNSSSLSISKNAGLGGSAVSGSYSGSTSTGTGATGTFGHHN